MSDNILFTPFSFFMCLLFLNYKESRDFIYVCTDRQTVQTRRNYRREFPESINYHNRMREKKNKAKKCITVQIK